MRVTCLFILFFLTGAVYAQDTTAVKQALDRLEQALVEKDSGVIKKLMHPKVVFGHSNGWVQNKTNVLSDMGSGYLVYKQFNRQSLSIQVDGKYAVVKEWLEVKGTNGGKEFNIKLFVLQQWVKTKKGWQLWIRQSAKQV